MVTLRVQSLLLCGTEDLENLEHLPRVNSTKLLVCASGRPRLGVSGEHRQCLPELGQRLVRLSRDPPGTADLSVQLGDSERDGAGIDPQGGLSPRVLGILEETATGGDISESFETPRPIIAHARPATSLARESTSRQ